MRLRRFGLAACLLMTGCTHHVGADAPAPVTLEFLPAGSDDMDQSAAIEPRLIGALNENGFSGIAAFSPDARTFSSIDARPLKVGEASRIDSAWPWASVTKQVLAIAVMQQVEEGTLDLDALAVTYLPDLGGDAPSPNIRQLLQHRSGLRNPDDSPEDADGFPDFYTNGPTGLDWCLADRSAPPEQGWRYNNCDYIVLGEILERASGKPLDSLLYERVWQPSGISQTELWRAESARAFEGADATYRNRLVRYGASAGLVGPLEDMLRFDRALLSGALLSEEARAVLWNSDPALGYMALGQWVFEAPLAGCDAPVRIVERRGAIGKFQVRNIILPQSDFVLAMVTDDPGFDFGEIWTGSGAMHDALSAVACP